MCSKRILYNSLILSRLKFRHIYLIFFFFFLTNISFVQLSSAQSPSLMNFQSKIVNKADGTNLTSATPCVTANTCDFRVSIYDAQTGGNLMWQEVHENIPILATSGIFNLRLNSVCNTWEGSASPPPGCTPTPTVAGIDWTSNSSLWLELQFSPAGTNTWTETFDRSRLTSVPFAYYADQAGSLNGLTDDNFVQIQPGASQNIAGTSSNPIINLNYTGTGSPSLASLRVSGTERFIVSNNGNITVGANNPNATITFGNGSNNILSTQAGLGPSTNNLYWGNEKVCLETGTGCPDNQDLLMVNNSGVTLTSGTVVVRDETLDNGFKTTIVLNDEKVVGVLVDPTCANAATCKVRVAGKVNVTSVNAVNRGNYLRTSSTAGQAIGSTSSSTKGLLGIALTQDTTPPYNVEILLRSNLGSVTSEILEDVVIGSQANPVDLTVYGDILIGGNQQIKTNGLDIITSMDFDVASADWRNNETASWYVENIDASGLNCNLSTDDRCGKQEFPRSAWLLATTNAFYIFNGVTDQMWMKFEVGTNKSIEGTITKIQTLKDRIFISTAGSGDTGIVVINFAEDAIYRYRKEGLYISNRKIGERNSNHTFTLLSNKYKLFNTQVNDIHVVSVNDVPVPDDQNPPTSTPLNSPGEAIAAATDMGITYIRLKANAAAQSESPNYILARSTGTATSSSGTAIYAFDNNAASVSIMTDPTPSNPQWVRYQFFTPRALTSYTLNADPAGVELNRNPRDWTFQGSYDGTNWDILDTRTNEIWTIAETRTYSFSNTNKYLYYRLHVTENNIAGSMHIYDLNFNGIGFTSTSNRNTIFEQSQNALDNNATSFFQSTSNPTPSNPSIITIRYDRPILINRYAVQAQVPTLGPYDFTFEASNDNNSWTVLDTRTAQTYLIGTGYYNYYTFTNSTEYIYYRLRVTDTTISGILSVYDLQLGDMLADSNIHNVANVTVRSAFDGNNSTYYRSRTSPGNVNIYTSLIESKIITAYRIRGNTNNNSPQAWTLYGSNDATSWDIIDTRTGIVNWTANTGFVNTFSLPDTYASSYRYYRFEFTAINTGTEYRIAEIELFDETWSARYDDYTDFNSKFNNVVIYPTAQDRNVDLIATNTRSMVISKFDNANTDRLFRITSDHSWSTNHNTVKLSQNPNNTKYHFSLEGNNLHYGHAQGMDTISLKVQNIQDKTIVSSRINQSASNLSINQAKRLMNPLNHLETTAFQGRGYGLHIPFDTDKADGSPVDTGENIDVWHIGRAGTITGVHEYLKSPHILGSSITPKVGSAAVRLGTTSGVIPLLNRHDARTGAPHGVDGLFTIAFWIYSDGTGGLNYFYNSSIGGTTGFRLGITPSTGAISIDDTNVGGPYSSSNNIATIPLNQWVHLAVRCAPVNDGTFANQNRQLVYYVNGAEHSRASIYSSNYCFTLGRPDPIFVGNAAANIAIDDVFLLDYNIEETDIRLLMHRNPISVTAATSNSISFAAINSFKTNEFKGEFIEILSGAGAGQVRQIVANTTASITVDLNWNTTPNATSQFRFLSGRLPAVGGSISNSPVRTYNPITSILGVNTGSSNGGAYEINPNSIFPRSIIKKVYNHTSGLTDASGNNWLNTHNDIVSSFMVRDKTYITSDQHNWITQPQKSVQELTDTSVRSITSSGVVAKNMVIRAGNVNEIQHSLNNQIQSREISYGITYDDLPVLVWSADDFFSDIDNNGRGRITVNNRSKSGFTLKTDGVRLNNNQRSFFSWMAIGPYSQVSNSGADLAENYLTYDLDLEAAEVVAIDPNKDISVKRAGRGDQNTIGVVATFPEILIGNSDGTTGGVVTSITGEEVRTGQAKTVPIALAGRVPVKVTLENGPIKRGDFLTISSTKPGYATKAIKPGLSIGRALENFDGSSTIVGFATPNSNISAISDLSQDVQADILKSKLFEESLEKLQNVNQAEVEGKVMMFVQTGYFWGELSSQLAVANGSNFNPILLSNIATNTQVKLPDLKASELPADVNFKLPIGVNQSIPNNLSTMAAQTFINFDNNILKIDNVAGVLRLQSDSFDNIEMFDKKFIFDPDGNLKAAGTVAASKFEVIGDNAGIVSIKPGEDSVTVNVPSIKTNDKVLLSLASKSKSTIYLKEIDQKQSTITIALEEKNTSSEDIQVVYLIIGHFN